MPSVIWIQNIPCDLDGRCLYESEPGFNIQVRIFAMRRRGRRKH